MLKRWIHSTLNSIGVQVSRISPLSNNAAALVALLHDKEVDLIFDVGANIGQYAQGLLDKGYRGRIVSFEPLKDAYQSLLEKSRGNPRWQVAERCCLGSREDSALIHRSLNSQASSVLAASNMHTAHFPEANPVGSECAPMHRLDGLAAPYLEGSKSPFLKIDVQGYEDQVLAGAAEVIPRLAGLQVELSLVNMYEGQKLFAAMLTEIQATGLELYFLMPASRLETGRWLQADCVFFRPPA